MSWIVSGSGGVAHKHFPRWCRSCLILSQGSRTIPPLADLISDLRKKSGIRVRVECRRRQTFVLCCNFFFQVNWSEGTAIPAARYSIEKPVFFAAAHHDYISRALIGISQIRHHCKDATIREYYDGHWLMISSAGQINVGLYSWIMDCIWIDLLWTTAVKVLKNWITDRIELSRDWARYPRGTAVRPVPDSIAVTRRTFNCQVGPPLGMSSDPHVVGK